MGQYNIYYEWQILPHGDKYHHMYTETLQTLGLAQNEARIYETLLREGPSGVGKISTHSQVHRRNVYDSISRLLEKGLVFELRGNNETSYQAVDPHKLSELLEEKQRALDDVLPGLLSLHTGTPRKEEIYQYHGKEGWKNYMREIIRIGKDIHGFGAKAPLNRENFGAYFDKFTTDMTDLGIQWLNIYDQEVKGTKYEGHLGHDYRFFPKEYSSTSSVMVLDDRVFFFARIAVGTYDDDYSFTCVVNKGLADSFRRWFWFMWEMAEKPE